VNHRAAARGPRVLTIAALVALSSVLGAAWPTAARAGPRRRVEVRRVEPGAIAVDGDDSDAGWQACTPVTGFVERSPRSGVTPSEQTEVRVAMDGEALYVLVKAHDRQPDKIHGLLTRRDEDSSSDWIVLGLDTNDDHRQAYVFQVNPLGVKQDARASDEGDFDASWDAVWGVETSTGAEGWVAEFRIPFSEIHYDPRRSTWGFQVGRVVQRRAEESYLNPYPKTSTRLVSSFGELVGLAGLPSAWHLAAIPYASAALAVDDGTPTFDWGLGGDLRVALGPALSLAMAINPDFAQVEADPSELNLSAYETFLSEKRPFFVEDGEMLSFPMETSELNLGTDTLYYSRRIGRAPSRELELDPAEIIHRPLRTTILEATKLTGRTPDGWTIGVLHALTNRESAEVQSNGQTSEPLVEPMANTLVARVAKDFRAGQSRVAAMVTHVGRKLEQQGAAFWPTEALTAGLDLEDREGELSLVVKLLGSYVQGSAPAIDRIERSSVHYFQRPDAHHIDYDPSATSLSGWGLTVLSGKLTGPHWRGAVGGIARSPGLDTNDVGYLREADWQEGFVWLQLRDDEPTSAYKSYAFDLSTWVDKTFGPEIMSWGVSAYTSWTLSDTSSISGGVNRYGEALDVAALRGGPALKTPGGISGSFSLGSDGRKPWVTSLSTSGGVDDVVSQWKLGVTLSEELHPISWIQLSAGFGWTHNVNGRQFVATDAALGPVLGDLEQDTAYLTLRASAAITRDLTLQLYGMPYLSAGRYRGFFVVTDPQAAAFDDRFAPASYRGDAEFVFQQIRSNVVLRWEYLPGSTAFLVWSHDQGQTSHEHGVLSLARDTGELFTSPSIDTVMAKLSYRLSLP
jgi:hypothetical protein